MKTKLTNEEITNIRKNELLKLQNELQKRKIDLIKEENDINLFITHAHNVYTLNAYNNDDKDGEELRSLRKQLFNYCIDHIKEYKLIKIELEDINKKVLLANKSVENNENYTMKLVK